MVKLTTRTYSGIRRIARQDTKQRISICSHDVVQQRKLLDEVAAQHNISTQQHWKDISTTVVKSLESKFQDSLQNVLRRCYPQFEWNHLYHSLHSPANRREHMDWIAAQLGISVQQDWYSIRSVEVENLSATILSHYSCSLVQALSTVYREYDWNAWLFVEGCSRIFWNKMKEKKRFMDWLSEECGITRSEEWYAVPQSRLSERGGALLLELHQNSLIEVLKAVYPQFEWQSWKYQWNPEIYWSRVDNQTLYLNWLAEELDIHTSEQWHSVTMETIAAHGGLMFIKSYLVNTLKHTYPQFAWHAWLFHETPPLFWNKPDNQKEFLDWVGYSLNLQTYDDWYSVTESQVKALGGEKLLLLHRGSLSTALEKIYPNFHWNRWNFHSTSSPPHTEVTSLRVSHNININQRRYFDHIAKRLGIERAEDWYAVRTKRIAEHSTTSVLNQYNGSLVLALQSVYPEFEWLPWRFLVPKRFWSDQQNHRKYFDWLSAELHIKEISDWKSISFEDIRKLNGTGLLISYYGGSLAKALVSIYPERDWQSILELSEGQKMMWTLLQKSFQLKYPLLLNYKHPSLIHPHSKKKMELDVYIPALKIAFEYQGAQHYLKEDQYLYSMSNQQRRDNEKRAACRKLGISLIEIPYWWNSKKELPSYLLLSTLHNSIPTQQQLAMCAADAGIRSELQFQ